MLKLTGSSLLRELLHLRFGLLATGLSATNQRRWMLRVAFLGLTRPDLTSGFLAPTGTACYGHKLYLQVSKGMNYTQTYVCGFAGSLPCF